MILTLAGGAGVALAALLLMIAVAAVFVASRALRTPVEEPREAIKEGLGS